MTINNYGIFNSARSLHAAHTAKTEEVTDHRDWLQQLTDFFGFTHYKEAITLVSKIQHSKDNSEFEDNICALAKLVKKDSWPFFCEEFSLRVDQTKPVDQPCISRVFLGEMAIAEVKFTKAFTPSQNLFQSKGDQKNKIIIYTFAGNELHQAGSVQGEKVLVDQTFQSKLTEDLSRLSDFEIEAENQIIEAQAQLLEGRII